MRGFRTIKIFIKPFIAKQLIQLVAEQYRLDWDGYIEDPSQSKLYINKMFYVCY
jgi:hypothetical protein